MKKQTWLAIAATLTALTMGSTAVRAGFLQTNLVSPNPTLAPVQDPNLINPWGMAFSAKSPIWVSDQFASVATLYQLFPTTNIVPLVVSIPHGPSPTGPTGIVFNSTTSFVLANAKPAAFMFATLDGTIQAWNGGNASTTEATVTGAAFTGLALNNAFGSSFLYAADLKGGGIVVFDGSFNNVTSTTFAGKFVDPNPIAGFAPYNIQSIGGNLFVTYAMTSNGAPLPGGYVDEFDSAGNFIARIATNGPLNAPWGLALAPAGFGAFGGDLLVGNLFDSVIAAINLTNNDHLHGLITVDTGFASPVGLWALDFGNGASGNVNTLYFTAGVDDQRSGLLGAITFSSVPEPSSLAMLTVSLAILAGRGRRRQRLRIDAQKKSS